MEKIIKRLHHIDTFACADGEVYIGGKDEYGKDFSIVFEAHEFLTWIDMGYIKKQVIKNIKENY
jgi:hypothetical protein|tara:strand:+ start:103 stop:294 length:192 start_codon:yes stop_codon:yes gene_type:complete